MIETQAGPVRGILFDKDGTLLDFQKTWARLAVSVVEELGGGDRERAAQLADAAGLDLAVGRFRAHSALVSGSPLDVVQAWAALLPERQPMEIVNFLNERAQAIGSQGLAPASQDLAALLDRLRAAGLTLGVATHDQSAAADRHLTALGVRDRFAFLAGYDSGFAPKPGPEMLIGFAEATGIPAGEVVVVGDSLHDLGMGRAGGAAATVGVLTGAAATEDLALMADVVLDDIDGLPGWLGLPEA